MSVGRILRAAVGAPSERRKSPRIRCRLQCALVKGRRRIHARVLDVSEGGLCVLSPIALKPQQSVLLQIDVPPHGPVDVEAVAWHVRRVKSGASRGKAWWSVGMTITKAGEGFQSLLPGGTETDLDSSRELVSKLAATSSKPQPLDSPEIVGSAVSEIDDDLDIDHDLDLELETDDAASAGSLAMFRVRIKSTSGPRTRTLTLSAVSQVEAESLARADLDESWVILEALPV